MQSIQKGRRAFLKAGAAIAAGSLLPTMWHRAYGATRVKVGLMLPSSGSFAQLGTAITNGFMLATQQRGGALGGAKVEIFTIDDESDPADAPDNANKLIGRDKVDVLIGSVHSGVAMGMVKVAHGTKTPLIIPNAGANAATGAMCAKHIFRTSFSNWQVNYPMGAVLAKRGIRDVVTLTWNYAAGIEMIDGFKEGFEKAGGRVSKQMTLPFPNVEFLPYLTKIGSLRPDAVFVFFAGAGAAKFLLDYKAAGLAGKIPLFGSGFLTEGVFEAVKGAAEGVETTLHYADGLNIEADRAFRTAYKAAYGIPADVYAVQGYDAALLLAAGLEKAGGNVSNREALLQGMSEATVASPRGTWKMSAANNPIQDVYLRKAKGNENSLVSVAAKGVEDPARGCKTKAA